MLTVLLSLIPTGLFNVIASAETTYIENHYIYTVADGVATIIDVDTDISGDVIIPSELGGYPVLYIGANAFSECTKIVILTIPENVKTIRSAAFKSCTGLTTVNFNATNCTGMGSYDNPAFSGSSKLKTVNIGENVTNIPGYAFKGCSGLTTVNFNAINCTNSGAVNGSNLYPVFSDCTNLKTINIGEQVKYIPNGVFAYCTEITSINIPDSVISLGKYTFYKCSNLTTINIPDGITEIGTGIFKDCSSLRSITIPNGVKTIGESAFYGCAKLSGVAIPETITAIDIYAFAGCSNLNTVVFNAENCTKMGSSSYPVFAGCSRLYNVYLGKKVKKIPSYAFSGCVGLANITITEGVTTIGACAFDGCSSLVRINIPDSVVSVGIGAFDQCTSLQGVYINDLKSWLKIDFEVGLLFSPISANPLYYAGNLYINGELATEIVIPDGITTIKKYAFYKCTSITNVVLPDSITSIGDYAFYGCTGLEYNVYDNARYLGNDQNPYLMLDTAINSGITDVILHESTQIINDYAFKGCSALTSVNIPESVTYIGDSAFYGCSGLTNIVIPENVTIIGNSTFASCTGITEVHFNATNCTQTGDNIFSGCSSLSAIHIGEHVTQIPKHTFYGCPKIQGVYITNLQAWCEINFADEYSNPLCVTGNLYFDGKLITELFIPEGVSAIGDGAFYNCTSLTSVTIPPNINHIGEGAFAACSNLQAVYIEDLKSWCEIDFEGYTSNPLQEAHKLYLNGELLTDLIFPKDVTCVKSYAFYSCTPLVSVAVHNKISSFGTYAFCSCSNLQGVYIDDISAWCNIDFDDSYANPLFGANMLYVKEELLTELDIPEEITSIKSFAFVGYKNLNSVTIHNGITSIGESAFGGCSIKKLCITDLAAWCNIDFDNITANPLDCSEYLYLNGRETTDIIIPDGVKNIKFASFSGYTNMTSLTIPNSVTEIGQSAFIYCPNIEKVYITDIAAWCNIDFFYYYSSPFYSSPNARLCLNGQETTHLVIPNGVEKIKRYTFYNCDGIESVTIPISLTNVEYYAFYSCNSLKTVYYQGNSTESSKIYLDSYNDIKNATWYYNACVSREDHTFCDLKCTVCQQDFRQIFLMDGGIVYEEIRVPVGLLYEFNSEIPTKNGYNFAGWSFGENGDVAYMPRDTLVICDSMTLYAQWNKRCYTCDGDKKIDCSNCSGTGKVIASTCSVCDGDGIIFDGSVQRLCGTCNVTGNIYRTCGKCSGSGYIKCYTCNASGEVIRKNVTSPSAPILTSIDSTTVILQAISNGEYSIDGISWQDSPIFENLETGKTYQFYQRYAKTDTTYASEASEALEFTVQDEYVYRIVFKNYDDTILSEKTYHYGDEIDIPENPTKSADNTFTYTFVGWDKEVVNCVGDAVYTATYTSAYRDYNVVFKDWNGDVLSTKTYHYGDQVTKPTDPTKAADNIYIYTFCGWDSPVVDCAGDAIYTATYTATYIDYTVVFKNWDGSVISEKSYHYGDIVVVPSEPTREDDGNYTYTFKGWDKTVVNCNGNVIYTATYIRTELNFTSIVITAMPDKMVYHDGEELDESGMVVKAYYSDGSSEVITDYTVSGYTSTPGTKTITVTYDELTTTFTVNVLARRGDVNGDGRTNSSDALMILQYSVGKITEINSTYADANHDGRINSTDALIALQISVGSYQGEWWFDIEDGFSTYQVSDVQSTLLIEEYGFETSELEVDTNTDDPFYEDKFKLAV